MRALLLVVASAATWQTTLGQLPNKTQTWVLNESTIIMPCNNSGFTDPARTVGWSGMYPSSVSVANLTPISNLALQ